jgi:type II restriction enzyme
MYSLNHLEMQGMNDILQSPYMAHAIELVDKFIQKSKLSEVQATKEAFNEIYRILNESKNSVDEFLAERKIIGEIKDEKQALKSIAGNSFSKVIEYIFLKNKIIGNIRSDIFITSKKSKIPNFENISTIKIGNETQKPDCDLVIYSLDKNKTLKKCIILSLKTSLRERAGQTYKWKLLMEIATSARSLREKYEINYESKIRPLICFATVNFYNEINSPQQRGMFKFFDKAFIAKNVNSDFICKLSTLPSFINEEL